VSNFVYDSEVRLLTVARFLNPVCLEAGAARRLNVNETIQRLLRFCSNRPVKGTEDYLAEWFRLSCTGGRRPPLNKGWRIRYQVIPPLKRWRVVLNPVCLVAGAARRLNVNETIQRLPRCCSDRPVKGTEAYVAEGFRLSCTGGRRPPLNESWGIPITWLSGSISVAPAGGARL
jgi:hypothetical protein